MNIDLFVPIDEITTATGLTEIQVRKDVRAGLLPGTIRSRRLMVLRSEWNAYLAGNWQPRAPRPAVGIHSVRKAS